MGPLGWSELIIIFVVALVLFGPRKLPELGRTLGKGLAEFKRASNELKRTWEEEVEAESRSLRDTLDKESKDFNDSLHPMRKPPGTIEQS